MQGNLFFHNNYQFSLLYFFKNKIKQNTIVSLRGIINGNVNIKYYSLHEVVTSYLISISHNYVSSLTPLHIPIKKFLENRFCHHLNNPTNLNLRLQPKLPQFEQIKK